MGVWFENVQVSLPIYWQVIFQKVWRTLKCLPRLVNGIYWYVGVPMDIIN